MNINTIKSIGSKTFIKLRKISPELALCGAIICGVGAVVTACIASRKLDDVIEETHQELNDIPEDSENVKKEALRCYVTAGKKLAKLYWPTLALCSASIALMLTSHGILNKRYLGTVAAYQTLDEAFKGYRKRVAEVVGDEAEKVIMAGGKVEKNVKIENENGEVEELEGHDIVVESKENAPYEFDFNRYTAPKVWEASADINEARLRAAQNYFNDILTVRGHVFLNEVLDELGLKRTPAGAVCGWVRGAGDDYIDFGYMNSFIRDYNTDSDLCKRNIHLNFNCDGVIWNLI